LTLDLVSEEFGGLVLKETDLGVLPCLIADLYDVILVVFNLF